MRDVAFYCDIIERLVFKAYAVRSGHYYYYIRIVTRIIRNEETDVKNDNYRVTEQHGIRKLSRFVQ